MGTLPWPTPSIDHEVHGSDFTFLDCSERQCVGSGSQSELVLFHLFQYLFVSPASPAQWYFLWASSFSTMFIRTEHCVWSTVGAPYTFVVGGWSSSTGVLGTAMCPTSFLRGHHCAPFTDGGSLSVQSHSSPEPAFVE